MASGCEKFAFSLWNHCTGLDMICQRGSEMPKDTGDVSSVEGGFISREEEGDLSSEDLRVKRLLQEWAIKTEVSFDFSRGGLKNKVDNLSIISPAVKQALQSPDKLTDQLIQELGETLLGTNYKLLTSKVLRKQLAELGNLFFRIQVDHTLPNTTYKENHQKKKAIVLAIFEKAGQEIVDILLTGESLQVSLQEFSNSYFPTVIANLNFTLEHAIAGNEEVCREVIQKIQDFKQTLDARGNILVRKQDLDTIQEFLDLSIQVRFQSSGGIRVDFNQEEYQKAVAMLKSV